MSDCQCPRHQIVRPSGVDIADFFLASGRLGETMPDVESEPSVPDVDDQADDEDDQPFATVSITISGTPELVAATLNRLRLS